MNDGSASPSKQASDHLTDWRERLLSDYLDIAAGETGSELAIVHHEYPGGERQEIRHHQERTYRRRRYYNALQLSVVQLRSQGCACARGRQHRSCLCP